MDAKETLALLYVAKRLFPRDRSLEVEPKELVEISKVWTEALKDIPFDTAKAALVAQSATSLFPPTIKEIRDYSTRMNGNRRKTAEEAWGEACEAMRNYGTRTVLKEGSTETPNSAKQEKEETATAEKVAEMLKLAEKLKAQKPHEHSNLVVETRIYRFVTPQGTNRQYEAEKHLDPEVWAILKHMGYKDVCESDNPDVVRGQFMRAWDSHEREEYEKRVIGGILPQFLKDMNLLNGGVNGELTE